MPPRWHGTCSRAGSRHGRVRDSLPIPSGRSTSLRAACLNGGAPAAREPEADARAARAPSVRVARGHVVSETQPSRVRRALRLQVEGRVESPRAASCRPARPRASCRSTARTAAPDARGSTRSCGGGLRSAHAASHGARADAQARGLPASLTPWTAKTFLARSMPTVRMAMDFPFRASG